MYQVEATVEFEYAHRLYNVDTFSEECRDNIHGHSGKLTVIVGRDKLNHAGMVIDFKLLKHILNTAIVDKFDHACILNSADPLCECISKECKKVVVTDESPTAEWMSKYMYHVLDNEFKNTDSNLQIVKVMVQETERNRAIYTGGSSNE